MPDQFRFGIGEWYGRSFFYLTSDERQAFAATARNKRLPQPSCLPRLAENPNLRCTKEGGVCSLRRYRLSDQVISIAGNLTTTCPYRFREGNRIFSWIGEHLLGHPNPRIVVEVGFLERVRGQEDEEDGDDRPVGKIDMVLVHPDMGRFSWCALEMQAVYFSGAAMSRDFSRIADHYGPDVPFPAGNRRPDYRSSGPKRLMPQLQIKVPTLRRWGKKMVVVVDESFFKAMGPMDRVPHITNCDIVWLIVQYNETEGQQAILDLGEILYTTLERAVEGLTAGTPVALEEFESRIRKSLANSPVHRAD